MDIKPPAPVSPLNDSKPDMPEGDPPANPPAAPKPADAGAGMPVGPATDNGPHPWSMDTGAPAPSAAGEPASGRTGPANSSSPVTVGGPAASGVLSPTPEAPVSGHMPASATPVVGGGMPTDAADVPASAPRKKKTRLVALIVALLVIVLCAGSAAAYVGYYLPNKPENVLGKALLNSLSKEKAKTLHFEGNVDVRAKGGNKTTGGTFEGAASQDGAFELSAEIDVAVTTLTADLRSVDGRSLFFKVGGLEGLAPLLASAGGEVSAYGPLIQTLNDQWFEINESLIERYTKSSLDMKLSDADREKLINAYAANQFVIVNEVLPDQDIKGVDSYHYKLGIDKSKLKAFGAEVRAANMDGFEVSEEDFKAFNKEVDKADLSKIAVEVWIGKNDKMFKQFQMSASEGDQTAKGVLTITDYNKALNIEKPEGAKSVLELLGGVLGSSTDRPSIEPPELLRELPGITL